jgi:dolichyl-phosphate beta-glucosyltransferase
MKTLSFIIPVYNEEKRLPKTMEALRTLSLPRGLSLSEVIFVNDGSTDDTLKLLKRARTTVLQPFIKKFSKAKIKIITYRANRGKGFAIKQGMLEASSDYALFFDADMSTPLSELATFVPYMKTNTDVIIGTRKNGKSTVIMHQPLLRELLGRVFTKTAQKVLRLDVTDFTCGFKAFSKKAKEAIFTNSHINTWGYDGEIMFLTKKHGLSWAENAVMWSNDPNTKVKIFIAVPQTMMDLGLIYWYHEGKPALEVLKKELETLPIAGRITSML